MHTYSIRSVFTKIHGKIQWGKTCNVYLFCLRHYDWSCKEPNNIKMNITYC